MSSTKPESITIDDVKYVRADSIQIPQPSGPIKIFVLDRGFVYVGREADLSASDVVGIVVENAFNIRIWGTKNGLGELVNGPLKDTKLDKVGTIRVPDRAIIHIIDVDQVSWQKAGL